MFLPVPAGARTFTWIVQLVEPLPRVPPVRMILVSPGFAVTVPLPQLWDKFGPAGGPAIVNHGPWVGPMVLRSSTSPMSVNGGAPFAWSIVMVSRDTCPGTILPGEKPLLTVAARSVRRLAWAAKKLLP